MKSKSILCLLCQLLITLQLASSQNENKIILYSLNDDIGITNYHNLSFNDYNTSSFKNTKISMEEAMYQDPTPGDELIKFSNRFYIGTGLVAGGILASYAGQSSDNDNAILFGGIVGTIGILFQLESYRHIGNAGKILNDQNNTKLSRVKLKTTGDGIGFALNINKSK